MTLINDKTFQMRVSEDFLRRIDDWRRRQPDILARAEAIRRLIDQGLENGTASLVATAPSPQPSGDLNHEAPDLSALGSYSRIAAISADAEAQLSVHLPRRLMATIERFSAPGA